MVDDDTVLLVLNQVFIAMYLFELIFRAKLSYVAVLHHIGSVTIAASAVAISLNWRHQRDAVIEFMLCYVWGTILLPSLLSRYLIVLIDHTGMFDVIAEFWPHIAIILYRVYPKDHDFLRKVFLSAGVITFAGTIIETIVVMWLWGSLWDRWTLPFRVVTPILHVVFSAAQVWGAWNFYKMWRRQKMLLREKKVDVEQSGAVVENVTLEIKSAS